MGENVYLSYYQMLSLLLEVEEVKKNYPDFDEELFKNISDYFAERTYEISLVYPKILLKFIPNGDKYIVSRDVFDYLSLVAKINVFDHKTLRTHTKKAKEFEKSISADYVAKMLERKPNN